MKKILPLLLLAICCFFQSCEKETTLAVSSSTLSFDEQGGKETISLTANKAWSASSDQDWCKVSPNQGERSKDSDWTITVTCDANPTYDARTCKITVICEDRSTVINVSQKESKALKVYKSEYQVSYEKQSITIDLQSNADYSVTVDDASKGWIEVVGTKGLTPSKITLDIAENDGKQRVGQVTVTAEGISESIVIAITQEAVPYVVFEDDIFKNYCLQNFDIDKDGYISFSEALLVTKMDCSIYNIASLSGIEYFKNITKLSCQDNLLTSLDVSSCTALTELNCRHNDLTELNVSGCSVLTELDCMNNELTSLDVSDCKALKKLYCSNNQLANLDVSDFTALKTLECQWNQLTSLDAGGCAALTLINCYNNQLTSLDITGCTALAILNCYTNQLTSLDVSSCKTLTIFSCQDNKMTSLDVSGLSALITLSCYSNQLTKLDLSDCKALFALICSINNLTTLDVSTLPSLRELNCSYNQLTSLDVDNCPLLNNIECVKNQLTILDISGCSAYMSKVDCRSNPSLEEVWLAPNQTVTDFKYDSNTTVMIK